VIVNYQQIIFPCRRYIRLSHKNTEKLRLNTRYRFKPGKGGYHGLSSMEIKKAC